MWFKVFPTISIYDVHSMWVYSDACNLMVKMKYIIFYERRGMLHEFLLVLDTLLGTFISTNALLFSFFDWTKTKTKKTKPLQG